VVHGVFMLVIMSDALYTVNILQMNESVYYCWPEQHALDTA
jgi:hypothetical protein